MMSRYWKFPTRTKGLIFTTDVIFAVGITLILLLLALSNLVAAQSTVANEINTKRVASDVIAILDYNDILDTFDPALIETAMNQSLPNNVKVHMVIGKYDTSGTLVDQIEVSPDINENYFYGKWIYLTGQPRVQNFYLIRYKVAYRPKGDVTIGIA